MSKWSGVSMKRPSLKVFTAIVLIAATLSLFQNCAQPAPETDDQKSQSTPPPPVTSDPAFTATFSPASPQVGQTITIAPNGGSPPYSNTVISGSATVSGDYVYPAAGGNLEIQTKDSKNRTVFLTIPVKSGPGNIDATTNKNFVVPYGITQITVKAWGAGGGGGGKDDSIAGGGGGGGAYVTRTLSVTSGQTFTIIVGVGGLPGANDAKGTGAGAGGDGGSGGAPGGDAGATGDSGSGGGGGGGTFLISGGAIYIAAAGGGGGGGAGLRSTTGLGAGGAGGVTGSNGGFAGGAAGGMSTFEGGVGVSVNGDGGGGGGGGGGYRGGKGGSAANGDVTGGGGGGGSNYPAGNATNGSGRTPGNASDTARGSAGLGGTAGVKGNDGRMIISW